MMVKDRSGNAFDTIRIRGYWWIPDGSTEPRKIPGELTFDVQSGGVLDLYDAFSDKFREIPVIHGLGAQGECVTIFNGMTVSLPMNGNSIGCFRRETIDFFDMWVGNHLFENKEEVRLKEYSFGIHDIENWADRHCFPMPKSIKAKSKTLSLVYKPPKPILLFEDDRMRLCFRRVLKNSDCRGIIGVWQSHPPSLKSSGNSSQMPLKSRNLTF